MAKSGNKTKAQTMIYKTLQVQIKIEQHEPHKKTNGELMGSGRFGTSCSTSDMNMMRYENLSRHQYTYISTNKCRSIYNPIHSR